MKNENEKHVNKHKIVGGNVLLKKQSRHYQSLSTDNLAKLNTTSVTKLSIGVINQEDQVIKRSNFSLFFRSSATLRTQFH